MTEDPKVEPKLEQHPLPADIFAQEDVRYVQIMGLQDTGTNLLHSMLWANFPQIVFFCETKSKGPRVRDGLWKHANLRLTQKAMSKEVKDSLRHHKVSLLAMVRQPLSWLQSIHKAPYELWNCTLGKEWLSRQCLHPVPAGYSSIDRELMDDTFRRFPNIVSIWKYWVQAYMNLGEAGDLFAGGSMVIRYEDLVLDPQGTMRKVADLIGVKLPGEIQYPLEPAKNHGRAVGYSEAVEKIRKKTYLLNYSKAEIFEACDLLKDSAAEAFAYHDCDQMTALLRKWA